ncbi:DNA/RNA non-specific endonuclease [Cellulomonas shaoxiangyii]|uniref:DNA/RNA non-specific endonuclease n=1 Tax=Cellulomonas shaoxiangyii TaxID=2566013 RepID=A0A4P7SHM4_9CELL|nr:DNA/RNA non-specific endonuclease [Cellulomonas shaoxiangyii]QCB92616.1 DNA/RNA non-specific endonuclease [Cellulomonas shaoxiangyii]TGY85228.1 DNA/RNA non-specific endonuclease [Cellulomonas shaoxiangyii]
MAATPADDPTGYDPDFLGPRVPLPAAGRPLRDLPSTHFTVLLDPVRRLAAATAVNVDGTALRDVPRDDDWFLDPRVPATEQCGPELYARNDLDRGHLVRRRDPVWGAPGVAARANRETFAYPNAAPQAAGFNQGAELWLGLEDHVLGHAAAQRLRLTVLTGPVLADDDPVYRGIALPRRYWKVVAWSLDAGDRLAATAFVLDQSPLLDDGALGAATAAAQAAGDPPPLGPFRTSQVPVGDVADLTGLDLGPLPAADVLARTGPQADAPAWRPLRSAADVVLR